MIGCDNLPRRLIAIVDMGQRPTANISVACILSSYSRPRWEHEPVNCMKNLNEESEMENEPGKNGRRTFLRATGGLLATGLAGGTILKANAGQMTHGSVEGFVLEAATTGKCGTCRFWGGRRRVSKDLKTVTTESLGMCNNPESMNYHTVTTPDTGPMKKWEKWEALG